LFYIFFSFFLELRFIDTVCANRPGTGSATLQTLLRMDVGARIQLFSFPDHRSGIAEGRREMGRVSFVMLHVVAAATGVLLVSTVVARRVGTLAPPDLGTQPAPRPDPDLPLLPHHAPNDRSVAQRA
jgi:hypothetical protein